MKNNMKKFLSVFLAVVMLVGIAPVGGFIAPVEASAASSATYDKEYYYPAGTAFANDLAVAIREYSAWSGGRQDACKEYLTNAGYTLWGKNMNDGKNADYIHVGYKMAVTESNVIRAVAAYNGGNPPSTYSYTMNGHSVTFNLVTKGYDNSGTVSSTSIDLNSDAGGDYIFLYYTTDPNAGPPISSFDYDESSTNNSDSSAQIPVFWLNTGGEKGKAGEAADLNAGAGGDYIYEFYGQTGTEVDTSALHTAITNGESYIANSSRYVSVSDLQTAVNNAKTIVNDYNADGLSDEYDQDAIDEATKAINKAIDNLLTTIYFDGNGGTVTLESTPITIGGNSTWTYNGDYSAFSASRTGYTFKGWSTSNTTSPSDTGNYFPVGGTSISGGFNTTFYAVWEANKYTVVFDSLLDVSKWNTSSANNGVISNVGNGGFTLTSNDGVSEGTSTSPLFPVTAGKNYVVDMEFEGANWDVYIFFYDANTSSGTGLEFVDGAARRFSSSGVGNFDENGNAVFTAPTGATRAVIRVDANGANNAVTYRNIKVYEQGTVEDGVSFSPSQTVTYDSAYGTLPTPTKDKYDFLGWFKADGTQITSSTTVKQTDTLYVYSKWERSGFTVTWKNHDGTVLETDEGVAAGTTPTYNGATPVKTGDAQYSYTFAGWSPAVSAVDGDVIYTATFTQVLNKYTVTWKNHDGTVLETDTNVAYGTTPVYNGATPVKTGNAQFSYTFTGWSPAVSSVTGDVTYTAQFSESTNKYTVTWKNYDETVLETDTNVLYGTTPNYDGATPVKPADAQYTYTFAGWEPAVTDVTGNVSYKAKFTETLRTYTVTWKNEDGAVLETDENVPYGTTPTYDGETPVKAGNAQYSYTFSGWTPAVGEVKGDAVYTAKFTQSVNKYTVTWKNSNGYVLETDENVIYGSEPSYDGETPVKQGDAQYTYTFSGWSPELSDVTGNVTYTAVFTQTVNEYTVVFANHDGTVLQSGKVPYGTTPVYTGEEPVKAGDAQYSYAFIGWDVDPVPVKGDAVYTAQFEESTNVYVVTWKNYDGSVLGTNNVPYGTKPEYKGETPVKAATVQYTYTFAGWEPEIDEVTGDAVYTAKFTETVNKYTISFVDEDGTVLQTGKLDYGTVPSYTGETPAKDATAQYTYTFDKWTPAIVKVEGDAIYTATYKATVNKYTVTWVNDDDTVLETDNNVEYGATPSYDGETPTKTADAQYTYAFDSWTPVVDTVKGNVTYKATYKETLRTYTVLWENENGDVLETDENVPYGTVPTFDGETPVKAATAQYTYTFDKWSPEVVAVTGDAIYVATFTQEVNKYTIEFVNEDGTVLQSTEVAYGETPSYDGETPVKAADAQYTYTFDKWSPAIKAVDGKATYTATYTSEVNKYTVTWKNANGYVLETDDDVPYGTTPSYDGETPVKAADAQYTYTFDKWTPVISAVTGNVAYTATFTATLNNYTVTWKNDNGNVLETDVEVPYGTTPSYDGATPAKAATAQYTYTFEGWTPTVNAVTGDVTYTATYTSTVNEYTITWIVEGVETTQDVPYGETPSYGSTPVKAENAQYTYEFKGWTPAVEAVTGDATYTAEFTPVTKSYTVTWVDEDGTSVIYTESILVGDAIPNKDVPEKAGFIGAWETYPAVMPTNDVVIKAVYINDGITVTWVIDDSTIQTTVVREGNVITPDAAWEEKEPTVSTVYTFKGWSETKGGAVVDSFPTVVAGGENKTYYAVFEESVRTYKVVWTDEDGTVLETDDAVAYNTMPSFDGTEPSKAADVQYTYAFDGWTPAVAVVSGDATYKATYKATVNEYTVTFENEDGTVLQSGKVAYGDTPVYTGETPVKTATAQYSYTFSGWTTEITAVTGEATYTAKFTETVNKYTVTWTDENGTVLETDTNVPYGTMPTFDHAEPTKAPTAQYTFTFAGWTPAVTAVTGDATYKATYSETVNEYTVIWTNEDGTVLETDENVPYGTTPSYDGETPVKAATAQYTFTFNGWTPVVNDVTGNVTYKATYSETVNKYTVTWTDEDGTVLETDENVPYGTVPTFDGTEPAKAATAQYTYTFAGWTPVVDTVKGDVTYKARYTQTVNKYTVTWTFADGTVRKNENVEYGSVISVPANTVKAPDAVNHYSYAWTPDVNATVTGNADYTEQLTTTVHTWKEWTQTSAPSCDKEGTKERGCEFCDYIEQGTIDKLPHTEATREENRNEPTCKVPGSYDEVVYCSVCNEVLSRVTRELPVVPHTPATAVVENDIPASCTVDGSYDEVVYCSVCNEELSREGKVHTAPGHTPAEAVIENDVPATCTEDGSYDEVVYCSVCDAELSREGKVHTAPGHTAGEPVKENEVFGNCIEGGSYDEVVYCTVCDAEISRDYVKIEVGEHKHGPVMKENIVEATCTTAGSYDEVIYCLTCNAEISRTAVVVPAKAHTPGKTVVENKVSATCSVPSSYDNVVYCSVCGEEISRQTITGTTVPHTKGTPVKENVVEAKCTTPGSYDNVFYCIYCDAEMDRVTVTTGVKGHTIVEDKAVEPTCDKEGKTLGSHCSVCGEIIVAQIIVPAPGHTIIIRPAKAPTCTNTGLTEGSYCGVCKKEIVLQEEIPALGHTDEDGDGICDIDGRDVNDMTPDDDSNSGITVTPDADGDGYIDANECDDCGREHINFFSSIICFFIRIMRLLGIDIK